MIGIVDYGMGNLRSVANAFLKMDIKAEITDKPGDIDSYDRLVLPGVGAFGKCLENLKDNGLYEVTVDFIKSGKPFLGICVGMQLLFEKSYEYGEYNGMGIFPGAVKKFEIKKEGEYKIPHMGWNSLVLKKRHPLIEDIRDGEYMYFVHSYYAPVCDFSVATAEYAGVEFSALVVRENVAATQFHPEKSQQAGLKILKNFGEWKC
ncbi:Imidazole glycerol phosphate synthase subunit hisH [Flexistipes sinusarabici DSM 4947]|uniref:Imidazole glycerol phosphate synthase subunit HisH n=2 Tax=Flexistipes sinusarabici TaxID=2352 RepID=F8E5J6_FLESM|nr:imidazole glycerol phosphate synthase subunit HisH [Flexistipes sinusarabici]AEI15759.1 Imidazole glycerol phosphate synthase subunit hisH [Flexistipes sinusarabici DSM 4947]HCW92977.1 imidazole glycerol phosphate synthase subunit HisH [Flexistipes sinusarabici]